MKDKELTVAEILKKGGHLVMHKNDFTRLNNAITKGFKPSIYSGVKIVIDKSGQVIENTVIATLPIGKDDGIHSNFKFNESFVGKLGEENEN